MASESMPSAWTRSSRSGTRLAPSRRENSLWVWRCTNVMVRAEVIGRALRCQKRDACGDCCPMRRAVGFVALVMLMVLLHRLTDAGPVEARATLALGFLLLVALLAGDIAVRYGMPRLIGAFLFGFFIGPAWLGLVRPDELGTLRLLEDGALVLIALAAGSRLVLRGPSWRDERPAMARLAAGAIALPL